MSLQHPNPDELVVTVLGGSGQGESVVVHIGEGHWVVIDSYTSKKQSLPFWYLSSINADFAKVEMVICTHWHSDHVKGLYQILSHCPNARFYVPSVTESKYYPLYFSGYYSDAEYSEDDVNTVLDEFNLCMKHAIQNGILDYLERDKILIRKVVCDQCLEISAISPSREMKTKFNQMFASKEEGKYKEFGILPNMCSSAIIISINKDFHILLGADLESNRKKNDIDFTHCSDQCHIRSLFGWCNAFQESQNHTFVDKYRYVKVSHHSSKTGYCPRIWTEKVTEDVIGTSTVFNSNLLPQPEMVELYSKHCKEYYLSSPPPKSTTTIKPQEIQLLEQEGVVKDVLVSAGDMGMISSRFSITSKQYLGTDLDGTAYMCEN